MTASLIELSSIEGWRVVVNLLHVVRLVKPAHGRWSIFLSDGRSFDLSEAEATRFLRVLNVEKPT